MHGLRKLLRIFIQHTPLAVRQREHDNFTDILRKLVRMRQQCIPGRFSLPHKTAGNEANAMYTVKSPGAPYARIRPMLF